MVKVTYSIVTFHVVHGKQVTSFKQKQHSVTEILMKEKYRQSDIHRRLQVVYRDDLTCKRNVHRWMKQFNEVEASIEDQLNKGDHQQQPLMWTTNK